MKTLLRQLREERGLTQEQTAQKSAIALRSYQYYETGERVPDVLTGVAIAETIGITDFQIFKTLFGAATPETEKEPDSNPT